MSSTKFNSWIYLVSLWINGALAQYYVQDANGTTPHCTLATPNITTSSTGGNTVQLPAYLGIAENEPVRVGYIQTSYIFLNIGCTLYPYIAHPHTTMVKKDIGQCYRVCRSKYIGVSDTTCFCFKGIWNLDKNNKFCTHTCEYPKGALCGGGTNYYGTLVSLYKKVDVVNDRGNGRGSCLSVSPRQYTLAWQDCNSQLLGLCTSVPVRVSGPIKNSWSGYIKSCVSGGGFPLYPYDATLDSPAYFWSGIVRRLYINKDKEPRSNLGRVLDGYIIKRGTNYILFFKTRVESTKLLCVTDGTRTPNSRTSTDQTSIFIHTSKVPKGYSIHTKVKKETTTQFEVSRSENAKDGYLSTTMASASGTYQAVSDKDEETDTSPVTLAVYVTVPVVVLAVVGGVICIVWIKRRNGKNPRPEMHHDDIKASGAAINATYDGDSVQIGPMEIQEHNYWVLEKTNGLDRTTVATTSFDNGCSEDMDYTLPDDQTDDVYDHTGGNKEQRQPGNDTYNHLGQDASVDVEDMYNATEMWGHKKDKNNLTENVYDRTRVDETYNTAQRWGNIKDNDNVTENVYDRTRIDDTYNTTQKWRNVIDNGNVNDTTYDRADDENDDNEYSTAGVVGIGRGLDDTYSHTVRQ